MILQRQHVVRQKKNTRNVTSSKDQTTLWTIFRLCKVPQGVTHILTHSGVVSVATTLIWRGSRFNEAFLSTWFVGLFGVQHEITMKQYQIMVRHAKSYCTVWASSPLPRSENNPEIPHTVCLRFFDKSFWRMAKWSVEQSYSDLCVHACDACVHACVCACMRAFVRAFRSAMFNDRFCWLRSFKEFDFSCVQTHLKKMSSPSMWVKEWVSLLKKAWDTFARRLCETSRFFSKWTNSVAE